MARLRIRTPAELRRIARTQVGAETAGQIAPYRTELEQTTSRRARALQDLGELYGGLQNYAQRAVGQVAQYGNEAYNREQQLFDQASSRLDQFRQQRAADAQALAQQTGGPVPISAFTEGVDAASVMPHVAAGGLMSALALSQADVGEAGDFAGRVFPLIQAEETTKTQRDYEDKISGIQDEIAAIRAARPGAVSKRFTDLLAAERDYQIARGTLGVQQGQLGEQIAARKAETALSWAQLREQAKQNDAAGRRAQSEMAERQREFNLTNKETQASAIQTAQDEADNLLYALAEPGAMKDYKRVEWRSVGAMSPRQAAKKGYFLNPKDLRTDPKTKYRYYYKQLTSTQTLAGNLSPISPEATNPATGKPWGTEAYSEVYNQMVAHGVEPGLAASTVRRYFNLGSSWKPPKRNK